MKASLDKMKVQQEQLWSIYLLDQYEKVQNNIIITKGKYLVYVTYDNPESIEAMKILTIRIFLKVLQSFGVGGIYH